MNECIICNGSESSNVYVEDPSINSLENVLARARERHKFKNTSVLDFVERTVGSSVENLKTNNSRYMKAWWKLFFWHIFQTENINVWHRLLAGIERRLYLQPIRMKLAPSFLP